MLAPVKRRGDWHPSCYSIRLSSCTDVSHRSLAEQHYRKLVGWFNLLHLPVELLTVRLKPQKTNIHAQLETGELPLLVGTHALIQEGELPAARFSCY